ncbi:MAG: epimerase, partial [Gemmatimonadota bacterium]
GAVRAAPSPDSWEMREWLYGVEKRECEDRLIEAWSASRFPATRLRLPMINGERDHYARIRGYLLRLSDGAPLLVPEEPGPPLRHLDQVDVVAGVIHLLESGAGTGEAYNLAADEAWPFDDFLARLATVAGVEPVVVRRSRAALAAAGVFPACSPFSNPWMSVLDNSRARAALGLTFTPQDATLERVVAHCRATPSLIPPGYEAARERERRLAAA